MSKIHIVYASTTGNTEAVCDKVSELLNNNGFETELHRAEDTEIDLINQNDLFILATSTWGHGLINPFFDNLLEEISKASLVGKKAAFVGLGDSAYEQVYFNKGVDLLRDAFIAAGGAEVASVLKIDGDPFAILDTKVQAWTEKLITALKDVSEDK
jgi:flavodoxin I